jgi:hypothetical protein
MFGRPAAAPDGDRLVDLLDAGVHARQIVKSDALSVYTGFTTYANLAAGGTHVPMNGNRAVNP